MKSGIQLYTLRDESKKDFIAVLEFVAKCGFDTVEFAGYYGLTAEEIKAELDRLGLGCAGTHTGYAEVLEQPRETIAFHKTIGCDYVIIPWYTMEKAEDAIALAERINAVSSLYAENGITLGYHNHGHEFKKDGEKYLIEILAEHAPALQLELDTYWSTDAGVDTCGFMRTYRDRIRLIHLKDGNKEGLQAIGDGDMDIQAVLDAAKEIGLDCFVVENDDPRPDGFTNVARCMDQLKERYSF